MTRGSVAHFLVRGLEVLVFVLVLVIEVLGVLSRFSKINDPAASASPALDDVTRVDFFEVVFLFLLSCTWLDGQS